MCAFLLYYMYNFYLFLEPLKTERPKGIDESKNSRLRHNIPQLIPGVYCAERLSFFKRQATAVIYWVIHLAQI